MRVEILHIEDCANWEEAALRVRTALAVTGHEDATIIITTLRTQEDAARVAFAGSPTITVDGQDLFPTDGGTTDLACRIYFTPSGLAGLPTVGQLTEAIGHRRIGGARVGGATS
ncbi:thioredoxin family protein [Cryobacterium tagatosivorans]|uniref:Thioredoxin family protein n=1 Tax=Cryobacterium tagatosivorans TaxID=1259199 RepID=A0A4R8UJ87_9MICO|nr:thioredoxin family protein [Cryobacterium tagatosivorans]TFB56390.1 thioredoxin family protein [Cryobacterium tagatosivorans]